MEAFAAAALRRGAYAEQVAAGEVAVSDAIARNACDDLLTLQPELQRLLVNASCRLSRRDPAIRPQRDALSRLNSRVNAALKRLGARSPAGSPRKSRGVPSTAAMLACPLAAAHGPRHICESYCYFLAYEPHRVLHEFLLAAAAQGHDRTALGGWRGAVADLGDDSDAARSPRRKRPRPGSTDDEGVALASSGACLISPDGDVYASLADALRSLGAPGRGATCTSAPSGAQPTAAAARAVSRFFCERGDGGSARRGGDDASAPQAAAAASATAPQRSASPVRAQQLVAPPARVPAPGGASAPWRPPHSPFGLIEELLWDRPWALLLCCILLNQTSRVQVDPVLARLLGRFPDAASLAAADASALEEILRPLGLHRKRSVAVIAFSAAFLKGEWRRPEELPGIGRYASDAHQIFCEGRWREAQPHDHALRWYVEWMRATCE